MSKAGIDFMSDWVARNVASSPSSRNSDERVEYDTAACVEEAVKNGISRQEIEEDIGDIGEYIRDAMHEVAADELHSDAAKDE